MLTDRNLLERGTHDQLMEQQGLYYELYEAQFEEYKEH